MRQKAVVLETDGNIALIEVSRSTMCDGCEKNNGCNHHCEMSGIMSNSGKMKAKAENRIGAKKGDTVEVETESKKVLGYATLVFLLPIIVFALFYTIAGKMTVNDGKQVAIGVIGFVLTYVLIAIIDRRIAKKTPDIKIIKRIDE